MKSRKILLFSPLVHTGGGFRRIEIEPRGKPFPLQMRQPQYILQNSVEIVQDEREPTAGRPGQLGSSRSLKIYGICEGLSTVRAGHLDLRIFRLVNGIVQML